MRRAETFEHMEHRIRQMADTVLAEVLANPPGRLELLWCRLCVLAAWPLYSYQSWRYWRTAPLEEIEARITLRRGHVRSFVDLDAPAFLIVGAAKNLRKAERAYLRRRPA